MGARGARGGNAQAQRKHGTCLQGSLGRQCIQVRAGIAIAARGHGCAAGLAQAAAWQPWAQPGGLTTSGWSRVKSADDPAVSSSSATYATGGWSPIGGQSRASTSTW